MKDVEQRATTAARTGGSLVDLLAAWLPAQRWFAAKGVGTPDVHPVGSVRLGDGLEIALVSVRAGNDDATLYQVPLSGRADEDPALAHALVGVLDGAGPESLGGTRYVYDGAHDPAFVRAWLRLVADGGTADGGAAESGTADGAGVTVRGVRQPGGRDLDPVAPARVLSGEQSNTSVIVDGAQPAIVKLFRVLSAGDNPDVLVQSTLAAAGCERVPKPVGWVEGTWPGPDGAPVRGHLAYAAEFLAGSEDAWRVACRAVASGTSFDDEARALGAATAQVHVALAAALPTVPATPELLGGLADGLVDRVAWAVEQAPVLADRADAARRAVDAVRGAVAEGLVLQQVHGDYHLGQVLHSLARGWVLLDFEGEPLRPLAERLAPDLALRDVAGMLRSFDYAARSASDGLDAEHPTAVAAQAWAASCREAFLDGYAGAAGRDPRQDAALLRALELDKALYEVVYETRNRPDWVTVPLSAVRRLLPQG